VVFSQITDLIGFTPRGDEKEQWLGLEGEPAFEDLFLDFCGPRPENRRVWRPHGLTQARGTYAFSPKFYRPLEWTHPLAKLRKPVRHVRESESLRQQLAASVQQACGACAELAERYRQQTGAKNLCLAADVPESGGGRDVEKYRFDHVLFTPPRE